jgi:hypothetical protein
MPVADSVRVRLEAAALHLHSLGPRALAELLAELAALPGLRPVLLSRLDAFTTLHPATLRGVLGVYAAGRCFAPRLSIVPADSEGKT